MNEFQLIERLRPLLPSNESVRTGPGDDCAVLDIGLPDRDLLFKTDAVVEGIHFTATTPAKKVGAKALARCLSDIAAMAGTPQAAVVTLGLPRNYEPERIEELYRGMTEMAEKFGVAIVGGETTTNPGGILISISMIGFVPKGKGILRSGALAGDAIFVTGELGGSLAGKHLEFIPRLSEGQWLANHFCIHSMIDLSDGLAGDLAHILRASAVGAELLSDAIPISRAARQLSRSESSAKPPLLAALTDGEDFELLFTLASANAVPLLDSWKEKFPATKLSCIGKITSSPGLRLHEKHGTKNLTLHGYTHFAQS